MIRKSKEDWFILYAKESHKLIVLEYLTQLEDEVYNSAKIEAKRWSVRKKNIETYLLPYMIFEQYCCY
jgi:hypothetical protein